MMARAKGICDWCDKKLVIHAIYPQINRQFCHRCYQSCLPEGLIDSYLEAREKNLCSDLKDDTENCCTN
jgi:hypothetical protein